MASVKSIAMMILGVLLLASAASAARVLRQEEVTAEDESPRMIFLHDGSEVPAGAQPIILDDTPVDVAALMGHSTRKLRTGLLGGLIQYKLGLLNTIFGPQYVLVPVASASASAADGSASSSASAGFQVVQVPRSGLFGGGLLGQRYYG